MTKFIKQVTLTGADDSVSQSDLFAISEEFPFVEWGILLSKNSEGDPRFPSEAWLSKFVLGKPDSVHASGHLCGTWVRDLVMGGTQFLHDRSWSTHAFERFQINFHAQPHMMGAYEDRMVMGLSALAAIQGQHVIFQMDGVNELLYRIAKRHRGDRVAPLFDQSGGTGVLPGVWPDPIAPYCGYAGGLAPWNLKEQLALIEKRVGDKTIWIDAETHLRTHLNTQFSLEECRRFLEIAKEYVIDG